MSQYKITAIITISGAEVQTEDDAMTELDVIMDAYEDLNERHNHKDDYKATIKPLFVSGS